MALTFASRDDQRRQLEQRIVQIKEELASTATPPAKRVHLIEELSERVGDVLRGIQTAGQIVQVGGQILSAAGVF
jgi:hypothetical protein